MRQKKERMITVHNVPMRDPTGQAVSKPNGGSLFWKIDTASKGGISMKKGYITGTAIVLFLPVFLFPSLGTGQSTRCVILEKQGNMAVVNCNGGQTRNVDLRGKADMYKVGDTIDAGDIEGKGLKERPARKK